MSVKQHSNLCMQNRVTCFLTVVEKEKQLCLTTRGVIVMEPMRRAVCLCAWSTNQNKALTGAQFSCGADSLCAVLPAPAPFSSLFNHCLFTLSQELNELWLRALPGKLGRPRPALPSVSPSLPLCSVLTPPTTPPQHIVHTHTNTHWVMELPPPLSPTHINESHRASYFPLLLIFGRHWGLLGAGSLHHRGTISCS